MKSLITAIAILFCLSVQAQNIVIEDQANVLNKRIDSLLTAKFASKDLNYTSSVDYKQKCDYLFAKLALEQGNTLATLKDCKDKPFGSTQMGTSLVKL
jgi:hypothetical protein